MEFKSAAHESSEDNDGQMAEINIVPLVDVMLVLLIIFMIAAPLSITGIQLNLPSSKAKGSSVDEDRVVLSINEKGQYFIEQLEIPALQLEPRMKTLFQNRERKDLYIRADRDVKYSKVIDAMSSARLAGVTKISMLTKSQDTNKR